MVSLGCVITVNSAGSTSNLGCHTLGGSVPVTRILGAGHSSKSRRLGLKIRLAESGVPTLGAGFRGVVKVGVAPEYGTPITDGDRAMPGTGVKTLKGGLSSLTSSSLCLGGIGGVGGGPLNGTRIVRICLLGGTAL